MITLVRSASFGTPITSGEGPSTHAYTSGNWSPLCFSVEVGMPEVPRFEVYSGCMVDSFSGTMGRSGLLTSKVEIVSQGEDLGTSTQAGTPATLSLKRFGHFSGSVERNGMNIGNIVSAKLTHQNNLDRIETIRADGKIEGADPPIASMTGNITVRFADATLLNPAIDG